MIRIIATVGLAALLALGGCGTKHDSPAPAVGSGSAMATQPAAGSGSAADRAAGSGSAVAAGSGSAAGSAAAAPVAVPTEMDFEQTANTKITDKNLEAQVQTLEKELDPK